MIAARGIAAHTDLLISQGMGDGTSAFLTGLAGKQPALDQLFRKFSANA